MTDKVQKIREEVERLKSQLLRGACSSQIAMETSCKEEAYNEVIAILDTMQEEHCTETEFREIEILRNKLSDIAKVIYYHEGKEHPTVESIREIVQDCCFELIDLKKPKQEEPVNEEWIKELMTKLDSLSKEEFKKVFDKYAIDFNEEPVSEELEEASKEWLRPQLDKSYANYGEVKMMELTHFDGYAMLDAIEFGADWQKENLWKPADGDDLPEYDREVIVLINYDAQLNIHDEEYPTYRVGFGHRPNPNGWDGKNIDTNEVTHYTPKLYDKGGWNAPNIVYWLDVRLPKEIGL